MAICTVCGEDNGDRARFCSGCGRPLAMVAAAAETRKTVTILFADVTGSTALGERLDPEGLRALMGRYFATMKRTIEAHGGTVEKFIGDAVMAVFGIPHVHEDDALRAVRAAAAIRDALTAMNRQLAAERGLQIVFRTGVNTGEVVAGDGSNGSTTLVTGDTVNTAARLEQAAPPGEVLLGRLTYQLVRDAVDVAAVPPIRAKGKADDVEAWRLLAVRTGAAGRARALGTVLVGRDAEIEALAAAWERVRRNGSPELVTLLGGAGVGKSRLVRELVRLVAVSGRVVVGRCLSYGEGITYWPLREIAHGAAGIIEADDQQAARAKLEALMAGTPGGGV